MNICDRKNIINFCLGSVGTALPLCILATINKSISNGTPSKSLSNILTGYFFNAEYWYDLFISGSCQLTSRFLGHKITKINPDLANTLGGLLSSMISFGFLYGIRNDSEHMYYLSLISSIQATTTLLATNTLAEEYFFGNSWGRYYT